MNPAAGRTILRARLTVESALAVVSVGLFILTLVAPQWIEMLFGVEPDAGSGDLELLLAVAFAVSAGASSVLTARDVVRLRATET